MCTVTAAYFASTQMHTYDDGENRYNSRIGIVKFGAKFTRRFDPRMQQYFILLFVYMHMETGLQTQKSKRLDKKKKI